MYRLYYDESGIIMMMISQSAASDSNPYEYIDVEEKINLDLFKVNVSTKQLESKQPSTLFVRNI
jgi:hypothetical protein